MEQSFAKNAEFCEMNKGFTETLKKSKEPVKEKRLLKTKIVSLSFIW